jgi:hypothetical protein
VAADPKAEGKQADGSVVKSGEQTPGTQISRGASDPEGVREWDRQLPWEMLPRNQAAEHATLEDKEFVLNLAEGLHSGKTHIDQIESAEEKRWWIMVSTGLLLGDDRVSEWVEQFAKVWLPAVEAQADDVLKRQLDFENKRRTLFYEGLEQLHRKQLKEEKQEEKRRKNNVDLSLVEKRWDLEEAERRNALTHRDTRENLRERREKVFLVMTVIGALLAAGICTFGVIGGEGYVAGGSGSMALGILASILYQVRQDGKQGMAPPGWSSGQPGEQSS